MEMELEVEFRKGKELGDEDIGIWTVKTTVMRQLAMTRLMSVVLAAWRREKREKEKREQGEKENMKSQPVGVSGELVYGVLAERSNR